MRTLQTTLISVVSLGLAGPGISAAPLTVTLASSVPSPQPVGTVITLVPKLENTVRATYVVQYSMSEDGGPFRMIRDFSQSLHFAWSPALYEHEARVRVTVRNNDTNDTVSAELPFRIVSRIKDSRPVVTPTGHPLVALFSAPACPQGSQFRVEFRKPGDSASSRTALEPAAELGAAMYT